MRSERVITVLEFLSSANKSSGEDHDAFLAKRNEYFATRTNIVEIDLHRTGRWMPIGGGRRHRVLITMCSFDPRTAIGHFGVREPLTEISIPLKPEDGFVCSP